MFIDDEKRELRGAIEAVVGREPDLAKRENIAHGYLRSSTNEKVFDVNIREDTERVFSNSATGITLFTKTSTFDFPDLNVYALNNKSDYLGFIKRAQLFHLEAEIAVTPRKIWTDVAITLTSALPGVAVLILAQTGRVDLSGIMDATGLSSAFLTTGFGIVSLGIGLGMAVGIHHGAVQGAVAALGINVLGIGVMVGLEFLNSSCLSNPILAGSFYGAALVVTLLVSVGMEIRDLCILRQNAEMNRSI